MGMTASQRIDVRIEQLVLDESAGRNHQAIADALEREIVHALGARQLELSRDRRIDQVTTREITTGGAIAPHRVGVEVAHSLAASLTRQPRGDVAPSNPNTSR